MHIYNNLTIKHYHGNTVQYPSQYVYPSLIIVVASPQYYAMNFCTLVYGYIVRRCLKREVLNCKGGASASIAVVDCCMTVFLKHTNS